MPRQIQELDAEDRWASQRILAAAAPATVPRRTGAAAPGSDPVPFHREPSAG